MSAIQLCQTNFKPPDVGENKTEIALNLAIFGLTQIQAQWLNMLAT
jgi:hypothetical protein